MRILVLCRDFPLPLTSGEKIRCYHILKELARYHEISLISLVHRDSELQHVEELKVICKNVYPFRFKFSKKLSAFRMMFSARPWEVLAYYDKEIKFKIGDIIKSQHFDVIWVNFLSMANYLDSDMMLKSIFVLDQHDADELVWQNYVRASKNVFMQIFAGLNLQKVKIFQKKIFNYFSAISCVSVSDADFMKDHVPANIQTWVVPNGVDLDYFKPNNDERQKTNIILLCAAMDVFMNVDAALRFAREIFPIIKEQIPDSEFWIVGRDPTKRVRSLAKEGSIKVTGSVEDVRPYYRQARVVAAPYKFGGGTKLKILEAMAMNLPVVSTTIGCQGMDVGGLESVVVRDDMKEFAQAVIDILKAESTHERNFGNDSRRYVEEKYGWNNIVKNLDLNLLKLLKQTNRY